MRFCENSDCKSRNNDTGSLFRVVASSTVHAHVQTAKSLS